MKQSLVVFLTNRFQWLVSLGAQLSN